MQGPDLGRAGGLVQACELDGRAHEQVSVDGVGQRPADDRLSVGVEHDLAFAVVARDRQERGDVPEDAREVALVLLAVAPRDAGGVQRRQRPDRLEQESVLAGAVREVVGDLRLNLAHPRIDRLVVDAIDDRRRVQSQVLADGGAADPGSQQERR